MKKVAVTTANQESDLPKSPTGIRGLDEITNGGLPRERTTLISGGPGTGKTLLGLCYKGNSMVTLLQEKFGVEDAEKWAKPVGWLVYLVIPMLVMFIAALWLERRGRLGMSSRRMASVGLLLTGWLVFSLNHAFFDFPSLWAPVEEWGGRTPNALIFTVCIVCLTIAAVWGLVSGGRERRV